MNKVVGSAIIKNTNGKVLVVRLNKEQQGGVLVPPGGKLEEGETLRDSVVREVKEELDIDIKITGIAGISEERYGEEYWTFIFYNADIIKGTPKIMEPGKILEVKWVDIQQIKNYEGIHWLQGC